MLARLPKRLGSFSDKKGPDYTQPPFIPSQRLWFLPEFLIPFQLSKKHAFLDLVHFERIG